MGFYKSISISPKGTWLFLTEAGSGKSILIHTQTSERIHPSICSIKAIAWSWDEEAFVCADPTLGLAIFDRKGEVISQVDIDWQGFRPNIFHGLLR